MRDEDKTKEQLIQELEESRHERQKIEKQLMRDGNDLQTLVEERTRVLQAANEKLQFEVSVRKQVGTQLKESHERLITIFDSLDAGVYVSDMETHEILFTNQYIRKRFGDVTGKICWQTLQKDQFSPCVFCTNEKLLSADGVPAGVYVWEFRNTITGTWFEVRDQAITWIDGRTVRLEIATDITERKSADEALRDSEEQYRLLFESNPNPMWVYDLETLAFLTVNDAAISHYGYSRDEFLSMTIRDIRPLNDIPALLEKISRVITGIDKAGIWRHRKKDGTIILVEITSHTLNFSGRPAKLVLAHDVNELRRAEHQREELIDQLQEAFARIKTLKGLLPICASCKKIRDDKGYWNQIELYISTHTDAEFTHSICPDCKKGLYPEFWGDKKT